MSFCRAAASLPYVLVTAMALLSQGCAGGASGLGLPSASHKLLETTEQLRSASPMAAPLPRELQRTVLPAYYVEPGDVLLVQPADLESPVRLPTDQPVLPDGNIELGRYGRLQVAGKTPEQIEREVQQLIASQTANAGPITVRLVGRQSKVFYVFGEVNSPGAYPLNGRETVLDAIVAAGGLTNSADQGKITYTQPTPPGSCRVVLPVCYREIVQIGDTSTNYQLAPGDRIFVPSMTLCQQIAEALHGSPEPECPPCGLPHAPCDLGVLEHGPHEFISPEIISPAPVPAELPAPQPSTAKSASKARR